MKLCGKLCARYGQNRVTVGAGEAIRTPDPNLGKVMLYP